MVLTCMLKVDGMCRDTWESLVEACVVNLTSIIYGMKIVGKGLWNSNEADGVEFHFFSHPMARRIMQNSDDSDLPTQTFP